jgi:hypothetical protein
MEREREVQVQKIDVVLRRMASEEIGYRLQVLLMCC